MNPKANKTTPGGGITVSGASQPPADVLVVKGDETRADRRVQTVCLLILTFIGSGIALALLRPVLVPFVLALLFTFCLTPFIDLQVRYLRMPRSLAVVISAMLGLASLVLIGFIVAGSVSEVRDSLGLYRERL